MLEEQIEVTQTEESVVETTQEEASTVEEDLDLSEFTPPPPQQAPAYQPPVQEAISPERIAEMVAERLRQRQSAEEDVETDGYVSKQELQKIIQEEREKERQELAERAANEQYLNSLRQNSYVLTQKYGAKLNDFLSKKGIDITQDEALRSTVDTLYSSIQMQKAMQLGRIYKDQDGRIIPPVFTPQEMQEIITEHYNTLSKTILKTAGKPYMSGTQNLSAHPGGVASQQQMGDKSVDPDIENYLAKKEKGTVTFADAMKVYRKVSTQKK